MGKILIIEQDPGMRAMLEIVLKTKGYEVVSVKTGNEGIVANENNVNLVIVSERCPDVAIEDLISALKHRNSVPILVIVNNSYKIQELFMSGMDDYLRRPFEMKDIVSKVENYL